ncbi:hypothetical protein ACTXT7_013482 [Hymenolepis weldensis]
MTRGERIDKMPPHAVRSSFDTDPTLRYSSSSETRFITHGQQSSDLILIKLHQIGKTRRCALTESVCSNWSNVCCRLTQFICLRFPVLNSLCRPKNHATASLSQSSRLSLRSVKICNQRSLSYLHLLVS